MNFAKLKEFYVLKRAIYKNLSYVSNIYYGFGNNVGKHFFAENSS